MYEVLFIYMSSIKGESIPGILHCWCFAVIISLAPLTDMI